MEENSGPPLKPIEVKCRTCGGPVINLGPKYKHANVIDNLHGSPEPQAKTEGQA